MLEPALSIAEPWPRSVNAYLRPHAAKLARLGDPGDDEDEDVESMARWLTWGAVP